MNFTRGFIYNLQVKLANRFDLNFFVAFLASSPYMDQMSTTLPYYAKPSTLPADLRQNALVRGQFVIKYGTGVKENEGHALLALERISSIPSPRLYAMYREDEVLYVIMEFRKGRQLSELWPDLSEAQKAHIVAQLRQGMNRLREIPRPGGIFASVERGPLLHRFFWSPEPDPRINGPFEREEDFSRAMALRSQVGRGSDSPGAWMSTWFARNLPTALRGHTSVFTHGDLQRKNILVEEDTAGEGAEEPCFKVTAILDWEDAGWYPSYWEYSCSFIDFSMEDDWPEKLDQILDPWPLEASLLKIVRQDLDF